MRVWQVFALCAVVSMVGYFVGLNKGRDECPQRVQYDREIDEMLDREFAAIAAQPSDRERVCDEIIDSARELLEREVFERENDLDEAARPRD